MPTPRDLDGRAILPAERIEALARVLDLRAQELEAGGLPYPEDWPLPPCLECGAAGCAVASRRRGRLSDHVPLFPCRHGVVADRVKILV